MIIQRYEDVKTKRLYGQGDLVFREIGVTNRSDKHISRKSGLQTPPTRELYSYR